MAAPPPSTITFAIRGPLARGDLPGLYERVCALLRAGPAPTCGLRRRGVAADAVAVDALARLQLAARRHRCRIRLPARLGRAARADRVHGARRRACVRGAARTSSRGGSPNSGNSRSVVEEERELDDLAVCDLEHLQRPRVVAAARLARLVLPERGRAVGGPTGITPRARGSRCPGPNHQARMSSRPASHMSNGGIDWRGVLVDQRRQRVDVVALEGVDVAREQLALARVHRRRGVGGSTSRSLERGARPLQRAVDRRDARVEQLGDLGWPSSAGPRRGSARRAGGRQVLERGHEREADRLARLRDLGGIALGADELVGDRLDPGRLGQRVQVRLDRARCAGPRSIGRARRSRPLEHVEADVGGDPVQPRAQRGAALEAVERRARRAATSPARRPRPRTASRACGSSSR